MTALLVVIFILWSECGWVQSCGDVGSGGVLEERDRAETPEAAHFDIRTRRSTPSTNKRKACGNGNTEETPLIR